MVPKCKPPSTTPHHREALFKLSQRQEKCRHCSDPTKSPNSRNTLSESHDQFCLQSTAKLHYFIVIIRFPDQEIERRALGFLARRFSGKSYATGETIVPEAALAELALEGIKSTVEGTATYERLTPLRDIAPAAV